MLVVRLCKTAKRVGAATLGQAGCDFAVRGGCGCNFAVGHRRELLHRRLAFIAAPASRIVSFGGKFPGPLATNRVMSAILFDLGDDKHDLMISNGSWRATVDVLRTFGILDAERLHRLETAWLGERVTDEEAKAIGNALVAGPLSTVNWSGKVYPPSQYFRDARGNHRDYDEDTQWPAWLRALAEFCLTCKGFELC